MSDPHPPAAPAATPSAEAPPARRRFINVALAGAGAAALAACGKKEEAPAAAATQAPAVAVTPSTVVLKMQGACGAKDIFNEMAEEYVKRVNEMSGGRLRIDYLVAGAVVKPFEVMDAVSKGVLALCYRAMTWNKLREAVYLTARASAMVCYLFVGSWLFSSIFSDLGGEHLVKEFVLGLNLNTVTFLLLTQLIIFILGWPLEWSEIIIIFVPIFLALLQYFGVDPIVFGILVALNLQTSFLTPPMAMSAYYLKGVAPPHVQLIAIFKGCLPFVALVFIAMAALYNVPATWNWLPGVLYGR